MIEGRYPKELKPEHIIAIRDSREQKPLDLAPLKVRAGTLQTGDYSVAGLEHVIAIERKELSDLIQCVTRERERFEKEMQRLLAYPCRAIVVEADWSTIELKQYRSQAHPNSVMGSLMSWIAQGVPIIMIGDRARANVWVARLLFLAAKRRWAENYSFLESISELG